MGLAGELIQTNPAHRQTYVVRGGQSGCFLPEVATDQGWEAVEFLTHCCAGKAHLPSDAWRYPDTKVFEIYAEG